MVDTAIRRGADGAPDLSSEERAGLRDLWQVYDAHYDEVTTESMEALARDAEFGPLLAGMSSHMVEEQNRRSRDMLRRAMEDDEWAAYVGELHEQGAGYATM